MQVIVPVGGEGGGGVISHFLSLFSFSNFAGFVEGFCIFLSVLSNVCHVL